MACVIYFLSPTFLNLEANPSQEKKNTQEAKPLIVTTSPIEAYRYFPLSLYPPELS